MTTAQPTVEQISEKTLAIKKAAEAIDRAALAITEAANIMQQIQDVTTEVRAIRKLYEIEQGKRESRWTALRRAVNQFFSSQTPPN